MTAALHGLALILWAAPAPAPRVALSVDAGVSQPISRYIYGLNFAGSKDIWGQAAPNGVTLSRLGGNRLSAYNWETNASNCGNDCNGNFPNDTYLGGSGSLPGAAVKTHAMWAQQHHAAFLATVPMLGFVAADVAGAVKLTDALDARRAARFHISKAKKGGPLGPPNRMDAVVYQDEFVNFLENTFPAATRDGQVPLWYSLDNEPDLWGSTHEEVRGNQTAPNRYVLTGYEELLQRSVEYASAVKDVAPNALVFGPALSNWNAFANLFHNDTPDPAGKQFFLEYYLDGMHKASKTAGKRLLDVLDVHWYAETQSAHFQSIGNEWADQDDAMVQNRVQAPRSLWDPTYVERSWVAKVVGGPIRLLPRLQEMVAAHAPGTKLAITEYYYHRGGDISGAVAQADALGIFGQEGVFAATLWPQGSRWAYKGDLAKTYVCALAAFRSFQDYNGAGDAFGNLSFKVKNPDPERVSLYASGDAANPKRSVLVAINKSGQDLEVAVTLQGLEWATQAQVWQLTGEVGRCVGPLRVPGEVPVVGGVVRLKVPALSVSTVVLR